jgi:hypothetical protein
MSLLHIHADCNRPLADPSLVACPDCDLLQRIPEVPPRRHGALPAMRPGTVAAQTRFPQPHPGIKLVKIRHKINMQKWGA